MIPAAVPTKSSSLSVSRPSQRPVTHGCTSWTASEDLFFQWKNLFSVFLSTNLLVRSHSCVPSHIVSRENPCCVSDRPRKHVCCDCKRRDLVFDNCQICSSKSTHCGDGFLRFSIALMGSVDDICRRICQSCPSGRHSFATWSRSNL